MAFTAENLAAIDQALIDLAIGERVASFSVGDKTYTFTQTDLDKLRAFRQEVAAEVALAGGSAGYVLTSTSKGL